MSIIGIDIDGVLASFEHGFVPIMTEVSGIKFPDLGKPTWPACWDWDLAAGITKAQQRTAWAKLKVNPTFWLDLPPHPGASAFLKWLSHRQQDDIYFITHRMGKQAKWQTERWLKRWGYLNVPTVIMTSMKGLACRALKADFYIDDKTENCDDVLETSIETHVYMLERAYNRSIMNLAGRGSLEGFRKLVEEHI